MSPGQQDPSWIIPMDAIVTGCAGLQDLKKTSKWRYAPCLCASEPEPFVAVQHQYPAENG